MSKLSKEIEQLEEENEIYRQLIKTRSKKFFKLRRIYDEYIKPIKHLDNCIRYRCMCLDSLDLQEKVYNMKMDKNNMKGYL